MTMWVWRLASYDHPSVVLYRPPRPDTEQGYSFQCRLLREDHQLTQGWGFPIEDLTLSPERWKQAFIECENSSDPVYRQLLKNNGIDPWTTLAEEQKESQKNYTIMSQILAINRGDTIFIPRAALSGYSDNHFTVVTVAERYQFISRRNDQQFGGDQRRWPTDFHWTEDFGHVIPVDGDLIKTFSYGLQTLESGAFRTPLIKRVNPVSSSLCRDRGFDDFLRRHNYPFNPY